MIAGVSVAGGWAAAGRWAWEPLLVAGAAAGLLEGYSELKSLLRGDRRLAAVWGSGGALLAAGVAAAVLAWRLEGAAWLLLPGAFGALGAALSMTAAARRPESRILGVLGASAFAPVAHAAALGRVTPDAFLSWAALSGYFVLVACLVIAHTRAAKSPLVTARLGGVVFVAFSAAGCATGLLHPLLVLAFAVTCARAWACHLPECPSNAWSIGRRELVVGLPAVALLLAGISLSG